MRLLLLSLAASVAASGLAFAQAAGSSAGASGSPAGGPQIPVGQTYKDFGFPFYQKGVLSYTFFSTSATGTTLNRAEASDVKIDIYTNGKVTTTITSPDADIYVADRVMRTKRTVQIQRADMDATAQACDFDLITRKYLLRDHVKVVLKNFDVMPSNSTAKTAAKTIPPAAPASGLPAGADRRDVSTGDSLLDIPGADSTNAGPIPPPPATP